MQECVVRPAVVVQCYPGGFKPPAEDPDNKLFTGIVVFSFDLSIDGIPSLKKNQWQERKVIEKRL